MPGSLYVSIKAFFLAQGEVTFENDEDHMNGTGGPLHLFQLKSIIMNITVQSIHFDANDALLQFIYRKAHKLNNFYPNILHAEVYLRLEPSDTEDNKIAEIKLNIPGNSLFAKERCKTFEEAADLVVESLKRQLRKHKTKEAPQLSSAVDVLPVNQFAE